MGITIIDTENLSCYNTGSAFSLMEEGTMAKMQKQPADWITVNGNHVPIFEGQSKKSAVSNFFDKKGSKMRKDSKNSGCENTIDSLQKNIIKKNHVGMIGAMIGALNDKNDPNSIKRNDHAKKYYRAIIKRNRQEVIDTISRNSGINRKLTEKMYQHLLIDEHDLEDGRHPFPPDYDIAQSLQRLMEGKNVQKHDIILIQHEAYEYDLMNGYNMNYTEAHAMTEKIYNYKEALMVWEKEKHGKI